MRADPALCFLEKVGMPDEKLLSAEQGVSDGAQDAAERWAGDGAKLPGAVWLTPGGHVSSGAVLWGELCTGRRKEADHAYEHSGWGEGREELAPSTRWRDGVSTNSPAPPADDWHNQGGCAAATRD